jgi:hypothetical protein
MRISALQIFASVAINTNSRRQIYFDGAKRFAVK